MLGDSRAFFRERMMKILFCTAFSLLAAAITSLAAEFVPPPNPYDGADTLRYFLSKSTLVVVATVESMMGHMGSGPIYEPGVVKLAPSDQLTGITVERILYGTAPEKKTFTIHLYQLGTQNGISGNNINPKQRYILFLKPCEQQTRRITTETPTGTVVSEERIVWQTADVWFGVFPFDTALEMELSKLTKSR
jgi:hypothetical protein